jgi:hypothetical protein
VHSHCLLPPYSRLLAKKQHLTPEQMDRMKSKLEIKEDYQLICMDETYRILLSISQAMFTKKQFQFLIETMQLYHFKDEQWNKLKAILIDKRDGFTDDQW